MVASLSKKTLKSNNPSPTKSHVPEFWKQFLNNPKSMSSDSLSPPKNSQNQSLQKRPSMSSRAHSFNTPSSNRDRNSPTKVPTNLSNSNYKNYRDAFLSNKNDFTGRVFGVSLSKSLSVASAEVIVQSELVSFGRIPIVVAKSGAYLKANALETKGIFRIAGNGKRVKELQFIFSSPPDYGTKFNDWDGYTVHDVASLLRRFLNNLEEPLIPLSLYEEFRAPLRERPRILKHMLNHNVSHPKSNNDSSDQVGKIKEGEKQLSTDEPANIEKTTEAIGAEKNDVSQSNEQDTKGNDGDEEKEEGEPDISEEKRKRKIRHKKRLTRDIRAAIKDYESLFTKLSNDSKQLTIYLLDLLSLFARQSQFNLMSGRNLAAIFQPSILSHPRHDMDPKEYELSRLAVEFLIEYSYKLLPHLLKLAKEEQQNKLSPKTATITTTDENNSTEVLKKSPSKPINISPSTSAIKNNALTNKSSRELLSASSPKLIRFDSSQNTNRIPKITNSNSLKLPKQRRNHSKSIGSAAVPPDVIASNKRRTRLFPWLHKPGILSDNGDFTTTEGEGEEYDEENIDISGQSPMSINSNSLAARRQSNNHTLLSVSRANRSLSGNSTTSSFNVRPISMIITGNGSSITQDNKSNDSLVTNEDDSGKAVFRKASDDKSATDRAVRSKKRESWFQRLAHSGSSTRD
ncbi:GTPase-activating protein SAC7 NDAI_0A04340 [Naumovozyma dairenensis CBS 421]|uniref:Rho-GAP domain-containing protein n=1 Tax=Naumovozyma dairenensis (strain ATCC 10597 / BCRC 20456 / CBS 421 / NBRC 0211 / NRRL Y-12639) TaxID=1071378 RepID=G0W453_NAUDC|nr:hypothetical protein NDAI_0A04340 [Naumovozyma dairenensis CBS 421]CCD22591.1 hypothetical protein NDAI_0A04340 [Naumovozyma dairenensis CBS 421]